MADKSEANFTDAFAMLQVNNSLFKDEYYNYMVADQVLEKYGQPDTEVCVCLCL
jgi:hypothetical protein